MKKISFSSEKFLSYMIYGSVIALVLGAVTSISILALYHFLMIIPIIVFLPKNKPEQWSVSTWALALMTVAIVLSIVFNQDIAVNGYKPLGKIKYFLYGVLSIVPISFYFKYYWQDKKISILLYVFLIATSFATLVGIFSTYTEFNPVTWRAVSPGRNAGLFGMVMNYAHNMAYFQIIVTGMVIYRKEIQKFVNLNFLYIVFIVNLIGFYLTYTRGAWLGFLVGIPFFLFKNKKIWFASIVLIFLILGGALYQIAGNKVIRPQSDKERVSQWQAAMFAFKERPLLGYGYLNFEHHSVEIKKRYNLGELQFGGHAHGNIFEMLGSTGLLGLVAFCAWIISWFVEMYKRDDIVSRIAIPFIVVFLISGLTQSTIALGINLFFVMGVYSITQIQKKPLS